MVAPTLLQRLSQTYPDVPQAFLDRVLSLLAEGAPVPYIARYLSHQVGKFTDAQLVALRDAFQEIEALEQRKESIIKVLEEKEALSEEFRSQLTACTDRLALEELYLPHKPRRKTKATAAREKGVGPLADRLWDQSVPVRSLEEEATPFLNAEKGIASAEDAVREARYILSDLMSTDVEVRTFLRQQVFAGAVLRTTAAPAREGKKSKYMDYYDFREEVKSIPSHRFLAIRRGEKEGFLKVTFEYDREKAIQFLEARFLKLRVGSHADFIRETIADTFDRLFVPSMENEIRSDLKKRADIDAITIFCNNFRQLLLTPPSEGFRPLTVDSVYRTGSLFVFLDETGHVLHHDVIEVNVADDEQDPARAKLVELIAKYGTTAIIVGENSTSRDIHVYLRRLVRDTEGLSVPVVLIDETASKHYSTSELAKNEFPNLEPEVRKCISLGRRYLDPLYELVKVDPKHIGVGQYQQEVDPEALDKALKEVLSQAVNSVGVDLNRASASLLKYISGLNDELAHAIVKYRNTHKGGFRDRAHLLDVAGMTPEVFRYCSGFLRVRGASNPLDDTFVHPEHYPFVFAAAQALNLDVPSLLADPSPLEGLDLSTLSVQSDEEDLVAEVLEEIKTPTRDPRADVRLVQFREDVCEISDLKEGILLQGKITNVTNFGVFVDIGVHQDGLVHVSELSQAFIKDPSTAIFVGDVVSVKVIGVDFDRKRISLSIKAAVEELGDAAVAPARILQKRSAPQQRGPQQPRSQRGVRLRNQEGGEGGTERQEGRGGDRPPRTGERRRDNRPLRDRQPGEGRPPREYSTGGEDKPRHGKGQGKAPHREQAAPAKELPANFNSHEDFLAKLADLKKHFGKE